MAVPGLQIPGYQGQRDLDFSSLAQLPQVYRQAAAERTRRDTLAQIGQGGEIDPRALIASGDMSLANLGFQQMARNESAKRDERDFAFRQKQAEQDAGFRRQSLGIQQRAASRAEAAANRPAIQKVKGIDGSESLVAVYPDGTTKPLSAGEVAAVSGGEMRPAANNPFAPAGKQTEGQANAGLYAGRMMQAETVLRDSDIEEAAMQPGQQAASNLPGAGRYYNLNSPAFQKAEQAQRNFVNATLRRESGAVISEQEFENARRQYFPAPGDSPDVIAQKRANRMEAIRGIAGAAGPSWRSPYEFSGEAMVRRGSDAKLIEEARDALERGADRKKVMKRLREKGIYGGL